MNKNTKTALIVGGVILAALTVVPWVLGLIGGWQSGGWWMMGPGMMGGFGAMGLMSIVWVVVLGLIIWAVVVSARGSWRSGGAGSAAEPSALEVLNQRYARGEISKEEYAEKKRDIT